VRNAGQGQRNVRRWNAAESARRRSRLPCAGPGKLHARRGFLNSRLATRIREKDGLSYGVGSSMTASAQDKNGMFTANAIYAPQNVTKLEAAFKEEIARVLKDGFTDDEVAAAKSGYLQSRQVSRSQDAELAGKLASYRFPGRTLAWDADFEKKIAALTREQIVQALRRFIHPAKLTIVKAGDFAKNAAK